MTFLKSKTLWTLILIIGVGSWFYFFYTPKPKFEKQDLGTITREDLIQRVTIAGTVVPRKKTIITAPYNAYVRKLFVRIGQYVRIGDPLVILSQSLQSQDEAFPIRSPINGIVVQIQKSEGEFAKESDSDGYILRIDDSSQLFVTSQAPEVDRARIKLKQEAVIKATALADKSFKGVIEDLSLATKDPTEGSRSANTEFMVKTRILDKDEDLMSGMSVILDIITHKKKDVLLLRHEYLREDEDGHYVILKDGTRKSIQVGIYNSDGYEVLEGLSENDEVVRVDFTKLKDQEQSL